MSDLVGNPEDRFSRIAAQFMHTCDTSLIIRESHKIDQNSSKIYLFFKQNSKFPEMDQEVYILYIFQKLP